jgi:magnesium transporter
LTEHERSSSQLQEAWPFLSPAERLHHFNQLSRADAEEFFLSLRAFEQADLILALPSRERRLWVRLLAPDDAADLIQELRPDSREELLRLFDEPRRLEVMALLAYAEDEAGGLMNPRYARVRPEMRVDEAISYLRRQAQERLGTVYYAYVLDPQDRLLGVVSFRELFGASGERQV